MARHDAKVDVGVVRMRGENVVLGAAMLSAARHPPRTHARELQLSDPRWVLVKTYHIKHETVPDETRGSSVLCYEHIHASRHITPHHTTAHDSNIGGYVMSRHHPTIKYKTKQHYSTMQHTTAQLDTNLPPRGSPPPPLSPGRGRRSCRRP